MPIVRTNPLPPGVYWQDIFPLRDQPAWSQWLAKHKGKVLVRKTSPHDKEVDETFGRGDWVLFEVKQPVVWEGPGFPSIAEKGVGMNPGDAYSAPEPQEGLLDQLGNVKDPLGKLGTFAFGIGAMLAVAVFLGVRKR